MVLAATLVLGMLGGCGKTPVNGGQDGQEQQDDQGEQTGTDAQDGVITVNPVSYDYEQELNIIDDNYRNYYEIFVYSFYDSDGDGIGDLNGVTEKLDYIADM